MNLICDECKREYPAGRECPVHGANITKMLKRVKWACIVAVGVVLLIAIGRAQDAFDPGAGQPLHPVAGSIPLTKPKPAPVDLSMEDRMGLMTLARDAVLASNELQAAVMQYKDAQKKQQDAMTAYQAKVQEASKKAGCELDKDFLCPVKDDKKVAQAK